MRFATLSLERYGRFEDCELSFRQGEPDLHVVYGANEAGKSTSLAAVSDLLFGFPARSPYNFVYDYALLRVGAVLEDEGHSFACRRKKGTAGTLIDAEDRLLDEAMLLAMLRGQTRETFALSFSLDQDGLRAGGRAMVEARNDLGRALFAAGSGLTGVADELARLESEADAIWGQRAAARRSFTQAQRDFEAQTRAVRDQALKPKAWLDAKGAVADAQQMLEEVQRRRDEVLAEVSRLERIRRIAPAVRLRSDHLAALAAHMDTIDIGPQREHAAEAAMAEMEAASRARAAAQNLVNEARAQIEALSPDPSVLAHDAEIDALIASSGAVTKGQQDLARLSEERSASGGLVARLRAEAGALASDPPTRIVSSRLREIALGHAEDLAALRQIDESEQDLAERRVAIERKIADRPQTGNLTAIVTAIDLARTLGADADARCELAQRKADRAAASLDVALARLTPWSGDASALAALPRLARHEIEDVRSVLAEAETDLQRATDAASRAREEAEALSLEMEQLSSGAAVADEEITAVRSERDAFWRPLRAHMRQGMALPSPDEAVDAYETAVARADERGDARYAAADESSRLTVMGQRRTRLLLAADQADTRAQAASDRRESALTGWARKLAEAGFPALEPNRFLGWVSERETAEAAHQEAIDAHDDARAIVARRNELRASLVAALADESVPKGEDLLPLLAFATRIRQAGEAAAEQHRLDEAALVQIGQDAEGLQRRRTRVDESMATRMEAWRALLVEADIDLDIASAPATLDVLDELRAAIAAQRDLQTRIDGIARDAREHDESVAALTERLGIAASGGGVTLLEGMRARLSAARSTASVLEALEESIAGRSAEMAAEDARHAAAWASLTALLEETGATDLQGLSAAIERSRAARALRHAVSEAEAAIVAAGDGKGLDELVASLEDVDADGLAVRIQSLSGQLTQLNDEVATAASAHGDARRVFAGLEAQSGSSADAASDAEQARAELAVLAEDFILKRTEAVTLRWAIEQYRERHQDPMLLRASEIFRRLTIGRYAALRIDSDGPNSRLLGLRDDGRTVVDVGAMSEGTTDQLFLALRLAAVEQSIAAGVRLPFLADDLFVNFDDERSEAGFRVLAELARSTQVLFFTHHPHLAAIARSVVGEDLHSECSLA